MIQTPLQDWLKSIGLRFNIVIHDGGAGVPSPSWVSFFVWCGWWLRRHHDPDRRLVALTVTPTRVTCSAFASLGTLLAGAQLYEDKLSWMELRNLPPGSPIHYRMRNANARGGRSQEHGVIEGFTEKDGQHFIVIALQSRRRGAQGVKHYVSLAHFREYTFTTERPPSRTQSAVYEENAKWFAGLLPDFNRNWLWSDDPECLLVTNKAGFLREISDLFLSSAERQWHGLIDLLGRTEAKAGSCGKMLLATGRSALHEVSNNCPVTILDGLEALRLCEHVRSPNIFILLDRAEYLDEANNMALQLSNSRDDDLLPAGPDPGTCLPGGVEAAIFALPVQES